MNKNIEQRFNDNIALIPFHTCWEWTAAKQKDGYGIFRLKDRIELAHRVSYSINVGPIPIGQCVCHKCDNPGCVNPAHLFVGTHHENMKDRDKKGRGRGKKPFDFQKAQEVRQLYASGKYSQQDLVEKFGCNQTNIGFIVRNKIWNK